MCRQRSSGRAASFGNNLPVFRHDGVLDHAPCVPTDRTSGVVRSTLSPALSLRHGKQEPPRVPNQPQAMDDDAIIERDVHVSLDSSSLLRWTLTLVIRMFA
jgi:hypothetical protein